MRKILAPSIIGLVMAISACSSGISKDIPYGIKTDMSIEDVRSILGKELVDYHQERVILGLRTRFGEYEYNCDQSLDNKMIIHTLEGGLTGNSPETVSGLTIFTPKKPRTLEEVRKAWGEPKEDGYDNDGSYYIHYQFPAPNNGTHGVHVYTRGRDSNLVTKICY